MSIGEVFKGFLDIFWKTFVSFAEKFISDLFTTSANILVREFATFGPELADWVQTSLDTADNSGEKGLDKMKVALTTFRDTAGDKVADKSDTLLISLLQNSVNVAKSDLTEAVSQINVPTVE